MTKLPIILVLGLLAGCASHTRIHVFSLGVEDSEIAHLSDLLEDAGFDVQPNSLPVPPGFIRHTVIFPAIVQDFATVELIESTMAQAGYPNARLILESEANHSYSTENIGVYLVNPDFEGTAASLIKDPYSLGDEDASSLTYNYFSECPEGSETQSELNLYPQGVAILEEFIWDDANDKEISVIHDGEWATNSSSVMIDLFDNGELRFSIKEHTGSDWFGPYKALTLVNQYSTMDIERCDYTHLDHLD